jgi:hypothetical protein
MLSISSSVFGYSKQLFEFTQTFIKNKAIVANDIPYNYYSNLNELLIQRYSTAESIQYRGNINSFYAKHFASTLLSTALKSDTTATIKTQK